MKQELLLKKMGLKKTKQRLSVLNILSGSVRPLSAEDIYDSCKKVDQTINLSTVYRILDTFLAKGIVIKPFIKNDTAACFTLNHHEHKHYLICSGCKKMVEIDFCPFDHFEKTIENSINEFSYSSGDICFFFF